MLLPKYKYFYISRYPHTSRKLKASTYLKRLSTTASSHFQPVFKKPPLFCPQEIAIHVVLIAAE
jgi:hypothetical protein